MRANLKSLAIGVMLALAASSSAFGQCTGQPAAGRVCSNPAASPTMPSWASMTALLDRNFGGLQGTVLNRGATAWAATSNLGLGKNGTGGGSLTLSGAASGSAVIGVQTNAGSTQFNLPIGDGTLNQVLITDGLGNTSWATAGSGTVSSVGLALPGIFTVSGSPVTGAGTLTGTLNTQSANAIWAGPTSGGAATPTFRALVGADLPNPGASSLGGVQSLAAVSSQWIRQISTSGVVTASQPAFTDISGTLAPAQCPNPSASTLGCIESLAAVGSRWINTISTSGVPSATQPNFTDIAGNATLAQLPSISDKSILANNSGGSAIPSALSATNILDFIATTQGDVLYRNGSVWTALAPGTNGQVLTSAGAAANPTWTTVTGTGTVTSIATNNGITGGTITTTGTIGLATISTGNALAYTGGGSGVPVATTPSALLDVIGSATGDILYRSSGGWTVLAPGTNGQVLTQGVTTPSWSSAGSVSNVTIAAGTGIGVTGTCNISTTGTCTVANNGVLSIGGTAGAFTVTGPLQAVSTVLSINGTNTAHGVPIWEGTSALGNTGVGSTGQYLSGNSGADPTFKSGGWTLVQTISCAGSTTCSSTAGVFATYNEFEIVFENLLPTTNATACTLQFTSSATPITSGYQSTVLQAAATSSSVSTTTTNVPCSNGSTVSSSTGISGWIRLGGGSPGNGARHPLTGELSYMASTGNGQGIYISGGLNSNAVLDGFIATNSSTWVGGQLKAYGRL